MKVVVLSLCLGLGILLSLTEQAGAESSISVGISAPLTGESAVFGDDIRDVTLFARDHFHDTHVTLDIQDDQCSGKGGSSAAQYFIQQKVRAVLGYACVESIMTAIPPLQKSGIPLISVLASGPDITAPGRNVFNVYPSDELGVKLIGERLSELKITRLLVLTAESAFPVGITDAFTRQQKNPDLRVTYKTYPAQTTDFVPILGQIPERDSIQAVFINYSSVSELVSFLRQRERAQLSGMIFTSYLNGYDTIKAQGDLKLIEGIEFYDTAPLELSLREQDRSIFDEYLRKYGHLKSSDGYFPFIFNGYAALHSALARSGETSNALRAVKVENGVGTSFSFGSDGAIQGGIPFVLRKIQNGVAVSIKRE